LRADNALLRRGHARQSLLARNVGRLAQCLPHVELLDQHEGHDGERETQRDTEQAEKRPRRDDREQRQGWWIDAVTETA